MRIVIACGTRPDVIKLAPVWEALRKRESIDVKIFWSGQGRDIFPAEHQYMLDHSARIDWSERESAINALISAFQEYLTTTEPDLVLVHGDDATAYACAVAAFRSSHRLGHVEAGLRTYSHEPYPEEKYRTHIDSLSDIHFAPDDIARENLLLEGIPEESIYVTGNTINDVLAHSVPPRLSALVTLHRTENSGPRIQKAIDILWNWSDDVDFTIIRHPNWQNRYRIPEDLRVISPLDHSTLVSLLARSDFIVTDSGGLQEECAFLGVPCLVYRNNTERTALHAHNAIVLCPPSRPESLDFAIERILAARFAYGKGDAGEKIADIIANSAELG